MVVQAILRIPELLVQSGYHQILAHQWLSWFAAWLTFKEAWVRFPARAVYCLHLFPCVITWFISSMAAVNWDRLNATTVLWVWSSWWCKNPQRMVVQAILRIPELLVKLGYHQLLAHQWFSWFAAWLTFKGARVRFPAMAVYYLHLFLCVITWFISSMAAVNWDRLNATTVLWVWAGWWCKILRGWLCKPSWEFLNC